MDEVVKVLSQEYVIKHVDVIDKDTTVLGMINHIENTIYIKNNLPPEKEKVTLIHEIHHAIFEQLGFDDEHDNEHLIKSLSTAIYQVLHGNKNYLL